MILLSSTADLVVPIPAKYLKGIPWLKGIEMFNDLSMAVVLKKQ